MSRPVTLPISVRIFALMLFAPLALTGCKSTLEHDAIVSFSDAMEASELSDLREHTTPRFQLTALRREDAFDDWSALGLPRGETTVTDIVPLGVGEAQVKVEVGDRGRKLTYHLKKIENEKNWRIDDIYMKQHGEGLVSKRAVTEQMDLLLSLREFLTTWSSGNPHRSLALTTPELKEELEQLPEPMLAEALEQCVGGKGVERDHAPEASMDVDRAVIRLRRSHGEMTISFERDKKEGRWLVADLAVDARDQESNIPSLKKRAIVMRLGAQFLRAYSRTDRLALRELAMDKFHSECLSRSDLSELPLPTDLIPGKTSIKTFPHYAEIVVSQDDRICKLAMVRDDHGDDIEAPINYRVEDVTLYDLRNDQQILVSSYFRVRAVVDLFADLVKRNDRVMASKLSTPDFTAKVWDPLESISWDQTPMTALLEGQPVLRGMTFEGPVTRCEVSHGRFNLTYLLRNWNGRTLIDDVLIPNEITPDSLKRTMQVLVPLRKFEIALREKNLDEVRRATSRDFNRLVWSQTDRVPDLGVPYLHYLTAPITGVTVTETDAILALGTDHVGARVVLVPDGDQYRIDDILLRGGIETNQQAALKRAFRDRLVIRPGASLVGQSQPRSGPIATLATPAVQPHVEGVPAPRRDQSRTGIVPAAATMHDPSGTVQYADHVASPTSKGVVPAGGLNSSSHGWEAQPLRQATAEGTTAPALQPNRFPPLNIQRN